MLEKYGAPGGTRTPDPQIRSTRTGVLPRVAGCRCVLFALKTRGGCSRVVRWVPARVDTHGTRMAPGGVPSSEIRGQTPVAYVLGPGVGQGNLDGAHGDELIRDGDLRIRGGAVVR